MSSSRRHFLRTSSALAGASVCAPLAWSQTAPGVQVAPSVAAAEAKAPPLPAIGSHLTLPEIKLLDGTVFQPAQANGRVTVIYWWASTCPFCALQSPEMEKLWQAERSKGQKGLQFLTLSVDRKPEEALTYMQKKGYTFPAGFVTPEILRALPKPRGLPITLVRGRDGKVLQAEKGQLFPEDVELLARWS
ncbi:MAG: TlpA family protein disulfide reductase [Hylemonella sp.]|jgi:cytochrome oxidase Cu insertion factor (SCO1/SenC/PrrC family)